MESKLKSAVRPVQRFLGLAALSGLAFVVGSLFASLTMAPTLTIPYTFTAHTVASAGNVNANFQAVRNVVNALDDANIAAGGITASTKLVAGSVTLDRMATDSVDSAKIVNESITSSDILDGTIAQADIATDGVGAAEIATGAVGTDEIAATSVSLGDMASDSVDGSKIVSTSCTGMISLVLDGANNAATEYASFVSMENGVTGKMVASHSTSTTLHNDLILSKTLSFSDMRVELTGTYPGSGNSWAFTLQDDGADTAVTCTIADTSTFCTYSGAAVIANFSSFLQLKVVPTSLPTDYTEARVSICFAP